MFYATQRDNAFFFQVHWALNYDQNQEVSESRWSLHQTLLKLPNLDGSSLEL